MPDASLRRCTGEQLVKIRPSSAATSAEPRSRGRGRSMRMSSAISPFVDDDDAVGERDRFGDVVRHQQRGEFLLAPDALQQALHGDAGERVERAERLVERENARPADQRAGERDALLLSAGKHGRPSVALAFELDRVQRFERARARAGDFPRRGRGRPRHWR